MHTGYPSLGGQEEGKEGGGSAVGRVSLGGLAGHRRRRKRRRRHLAGARGRPTLEFPVSIDPSGNCLESLQYFFLRPYLGARRSRRPPMLRTNLMHSRDFKVDLNFLSED